MATRRNVRHGRRGELLLSIHDAVEMLRTEGSDVEGDDDDSNKSDFDPLNVSTEEESDTEVESADRGRDVADSNTGTSSQVDRPASASATDSDVEEETDDFVSVITSDWTDNFAFFPLPHPFSGTSGMSVDWPVNTQAVQFFELFFDNIMLRHIRDQTNKYARENLAQRGELSPHSLFRRWKPVSENDIRGFLALLIHMGLVHKPQIQDYWSMNPALQTSFAPKMMPRNRFLLILAMLHIADNSTFVPRGEEGHDPLHKVKPVYTALREKFKDAYTPEQNMCVDEAMCPWRGKSRMRVYMKDKPVKWGLKLYELCESSSGYVYDFEIYAGDPQISNRPVDVVMRLTEPLLNTGRTVYVDNYYCCPELADLLTQAGTNCVGTVRANRRGMPPLLRDTQPRPGEVVAFRKGG